MKKNQQAEETLQFDYLASETPEYAPIAQQFSTVPAIVNADVFLDSFLAAIKWIFLYVPGTAFIHLMIVGFSLLFFYDNWSAEILIGSLGAAAAGTFMIMLGVGKFTDLRYLRVVLGILASSALATVLYTILMAFIPGDFFGLFYLISLFLSLFIGYMVKRNTDAMGDTV